MLKKPATLLIGLGMVYLITLGCVCFTSYGFPYSDDPQSPTPQRYWIFVSYLYWDSLKFGKFSIDGNTL